MPRKQRTGSAADWLKRAQSSLAMAKITWATRIIETGEGNYTAERKKILANFRLESLKKKSAG